MLVIRCAACKRKLWKYDKIGRGEVLRCHKDRITRRYEVKEEEDRIKCLCGKDIGIGKDRGHGKDRGQVYILDRGEHRYQVSTFNIVAKC